MSWSLPKTRRSSEFKSLVFRSTNVVEAERCSFVGLTTAAKGRSSTAAIIRAHLNGKLPGTLLIDGVQRLDHLRFDLERVRDLAEHEHFRDLHRLTTVATMLGVDLKAVKKLVSKKNGGPLLSLAPAHVIRKRRGGAYVSSAEIEKFQSRYLPVALIARELGVHSRMVERLLCNRGIAPEFDPVWLGARVYRREDVSEFIAEQLETRTKKADEEIRAITRKSA